MWLGFLIGLSLAVKVIADHVNKNNFIDKSLKLLEDQETCCNKCGRSVAFKSGLWFNRLMDRDSYEARKSKGVKYPIGDFICGD